MTYAYSKLCRKGEQDLYYAQFDPPPSGRPPNFGPPPGGPPPFGSPPMGPPNFGPPSGGPPPFGPPPMGPPNFGPPPGGPPPNFSPARPAWQVGPSGIRSCLFRHTYIWLDSGRSFWFYPVAVTRDVVTGFRWSSRNGWRLRTINVNNIRSFQCF